MGPPGYMDQYINDREIIDQLKKGALWLLSGVPRGVSGIPFG